MEFKRFIGVISPEASASPSVEIVQPIKAGSPEYFHTIQAYVGGVETKLRLKQQSASIATRHTLLQLLGKPITKWPISPDTKMIGIVNDLGRDTIQFNTIQFQRIDDPSQFTERTIRTYPLEDVLTVASPEFTDFWQYVSNEGKVTWKAYIEQRNSQENFAFINPNASLIVLPEKKWQAVFSPHDQTVIKWPDAAVDAYELSEVPDFLPEAYKAYLREIKQLGIKVFDDINAGHTMFKGSGWASELFKRLYIPSSALVNDYRAYLHSVAQEFGMNAEDIIDAYSLLMELQSASEENRIVPRLAVEFSPNDIHYQHMHVRLINTLQKE